MSGPQGYSGVPTQKTAVSVDEAFTRNLIWEFSPSMVSAERGDLQNEFIEITEDEANQIVDRIRATVTGTSNG